MKNLPRKVIILLIVIINNIMIYGHFPKSWKIAKVIPIYKSVKDSSMPTSYRPISLLSTIRKITEKVIHKHIIAHIEENNIIKQEQFGFKSMHSTTMQLARVTDKITHNFNLNKYTGMVLLDIEKAFDTVWIQGLIHKLITNNFPPYIIKIINSYLTDRKFYVSINSAKSHIKSIAAGVPQGSILGPTLFNIYINDINNTKDTELYLYADDAAITRSSYRVDTIKNRLQTNIVKYNKELIK